MRERAQYEKEMKDADKAGEEGAVLEVWDGGPPGRNGAAMDVDGGGEVKKTKKGKKTSKGKGKAKAKQIAEQPLPLVVKEEIPKIGTKRRRPSIDPFAGALHSFWSCALIIFTLLQDMEMIFLR
jgi:hypothetical protein